jgi:hypothetical protein
VPTSTGAHSGHSSPSSLKERTYPDTAVVVTYRYKSEYKAIHEDLRAIFVIWAKPGEYSVFRPLAPSSDEMWTETGEELVFLWFIEPDYEGGQSEPSPH